MKYFDIFLNGEFRALVREKSKRLTWRGQGDENVATLFRLRVFPAGVAGSSGIPKNSSPRRTGAGGDANHMGRNRLGQAGWKGAGCPFKSTGNK